MKMIKPAETQPEVTDFFQRTLDALLVHIAILQADGTIIAVNAAWNNFATQNGLVESLCGPGTNYLRVCEQATGPCSEESHAVAGIRDVSDGRIADFAMEYPCHSESEQRWFTVRVTRFVLRGEDPHRRHARQHHRPQDRRRCACSGPIGCSKSRRRPTS